jgi:hypothetical protein
MIENRAGSATGNVHAPKSAVQCIPLPHVAQKDKLNQYERPPNRRGADDGLAALVPTATWLDFQEKRG